MNRNADRIRRWSVLVLLSLLPGCDDTLEFAGCGVAGMSGAGTLNSGDAYPPNYLDMDSYPGQVFPVGEMGPELRITASEDPAAHSSSTGMSLAWGCPGNCWAGSYSKDWQMVRLSRVDGRPFYAAPSLFAAEPYRPYEAVITSEGGGTLTFDGAAPVGFDAFQPREDWYGTWIQFEVNRDRYLYVEDMKVCWTAEHVP